jgi:uncharacterized protein (DUF433 family)
MRYMAQPMSLRLPETTVARLGEHANRRHVAPRTLAQRYVEEGLRMDDHRRARLVGTGLDVWEVIAVVRDNHADIHAAADYLEISAGLVQAVVTYYGAYTVEIDEAIELNRRESQQAHTAWIDGLAALNR